MTAKWISALGMAAISLSVGAQSPPPQHFALTAHHVAQALSARGIRIPDQQVSLLANVVASEPNPVLDILSLEPFGDRSAGQQSESRSRVRLACHQPRVCLPFYALAKLPEGGAPGASPAGASKPNSAITIRAGARATLVMDDSRSHIQIAVITLENGVAGHRIRVASPDHKQIYVAEVVSAGLLKRSF